MNSDLKSVKFFNSIINLILNLVIFLNLIIHLFGFEKLNSEFDQFGFNPKFINLVLSPNNIFCRIKNMSLVIDNNEIMYYKYISTIL